MARTIHIIGAGLAGLAAAVRLSETGDRIVVHEATAQAGGRCRSYHDQATGLLIDNGNHLVLSGNHAVRGYARTIGSEDRLVGPAHAEFPFADLKTGERWTLKINDGRLPWWMLKSADRVPGTQFTDYLKLAPLLWTGANKTVGEVVTCSGLLYDRLLHPLLLAALNTEPREGSAALAGTIVRETIGTGGEACRPLVAREGLSGALVDPAIAYLQARNVAIQFGRELHALRPDGQRIAALDFGTETVDLGPNDRVILAVPAYAAAALVPSLQVPTTFRAIVNAHFRYEPPTGFPALIGVINATTEWVFGFPGRLSVTISNADRLITAPREELAQTIWQEVAAVAGIAAALPPWQIVRERRATFAATPIESAKRPGSQTAWSNLILAGDWTATGLPATLEGAIRSGNRAAEAITG